MVIDILPGSKLDISKYLERNGVKVHPDMHKQNKFKVKCQHDEFCPIFNELVMIKDFKRDDELSIKHRMDYIQDKMFVMENNHISNLIYCKLSNKKLFKHYMKELKSRRRHWNYYAIVAKKDNAAYTKKEQKLINELIPVLDQCQVQYKIFDKWQNLTYLRKDILKEIQSIEKKIDKESEDQQ
jgi:hypothetical protein